MKFAKKLTVLVLASIPFACGDDSAPIGDDSSSTGGDDSSDDDPSAVTITTADPDSSSSSSSGDPTTMTTVDPDSTSTDDPTDATESSSSSTDPTKGEESSSSSTDPTKGEESSSSSTGIDPTEASSSESGGSESSTGGMMMTCADEDLGSAVPVSVDLDTTMGDSTFEGSCNNSDGSPDYTYEWTAPADGRYIFTTSRIETAFDTILYLLDTDCDGAELICDDEGGALGNTSLVTRDMAMGDTVIVVVDGWQTASSGAAQLYIDVLPDPADGGSCCTAQDGVGGCDASAFETCVCNFDEACCSVEWTDACAAEAVDVCGASCEVPACVEPQGLCVDPGDDCSCVGCNDNGICGADDDCTCADCLGDVVCGCNDDGSCDPYAEDCACADCADEDVCGGVVPPSGCTEDPDNGCTEPFDDCSCFACVDDGSCDVEEDCVCADCTGEVFCGGGACVDDDVCDVYNEGCSCADCADEDVCDGGGPVGSCDPIDLAASLDGTEATFNRPNGVVGPGCGPSGGGTAVFYDVYEFELTGAGPHDLLASTCDATAFDNYLLVYQAPDGSANPFNPASSCTNLVGLADDVCGAAAELSLATLVEGSVQVVATSFSNGVTGNYSIDISSTTCQ